MLAVQNALESRRHTVRGNARAGTGVTVRQGQEIVALIGAEAKSFGQRIEDLVGDPDVTGLFEAGVPAGADPRKVGDVFPPQAGGSP